MHGRTRAADVENGLVDTVGEGDSGTNGESSINIYTLPYVKQIDSLWEVGILVQHREPSLALCDELKGWDGGRGGRLKTKVIYV